AFRFRGLQGGELVGVSGALLQRRRNKRQDLGAAVRAPDPLIEPSSGLLADSAALEQGRQQCRRRKGVTEPGRQALVQRRENQREHVESREVERAERRALRPPERR